MRGFLVGSLTLIILDVLLQPGSTNRLTAANNTAIGMFRRFLAADVAGIPDRTGSVAQHTPVGPIVNNEFNAVQGAIAQQGLGGGLVGSSIGAATH